MKAYKHSHMSVAALLRELVCFANLAKYGPDAGWNLCVQIFDGMFSNVKRVSSAEVRHEVFGNGNGVRWLEHCGTERKWCGITRQSMSTRDASIGNRSAMRFGDETAQETR